MKVVAANGKKAVVMTRGEWKAIGKKAQWDGASGAPRGVIDGLGDAEVVIGLCSPVVSHRLRELSEFTSGDESAVLTKAADVVDRLEEEARKIAGSEG